MKISVSAERWALPLIALGLLGTFVCVLLIHDVDAALVATLSTPLAAVTGAIAASIGRPGDASPDQGQQ